MNTAFTIIYLLSVPLLVMWLSKRWTWIDKVSPMTVLYAIGLMVANLIPADNGLLNLNADINTLFSNVAVPIAIPLMLMGCDMGGWQVGKALKVFFSGLIAILVMTLAGYFIFRPEGDAGHHAFAQVSAVATGIYTGGIPNMGAIKQAVGMPHDTYLYLTSYDLIVTSIYLIFVIVAGKRFFRWVLPKESKVSSPAQHDIKAGKGTDAHHDMDTTHKGLNIFDREHLPGTLWSCGLTLAIAAVSYLISLGGSKDGGPNMTVLILLLTTLAIAASFLPPMKRQQHSFDIGLYFVYVFCLAIASSCDIRQMDIAGSLSILYYLAFIVLGSLAVQILLARLLKIDGDSVMVCSIALINSPPFVPMAAALLNNKNIVVLGITIGLLGYMLGNYLGIGIYHLLCLL